MDDRQFQEWMRRMADTDENVGRPNANAIWWRAQLRRRLEAEQQMIRPIRIAENAAGISCWLLVAIVSAGMGTQGFVAFLGISVAIIGGLGVIALQKT